MAINRTLTVAPTFPTGETVSLFRGALPDSSLAGNYPGTVVATDTVNAAGKVTFTNLDEATSYVMSALIGGSYRFIEFRTDTAPGGLTIDTEGQLSDGSDYVLLESSGTGAAVSVLREAPANAKDPEYGAVADGSTDDSAALTTLFTAVANAPKGRGYLPAGTYRLGDVSLPDEGLEVFGDGIGTVLQAKAGATYVLKNQGHRYQAFRNLVIDGNNRAARGLLTESSAGATSQNQVFDRVRFYRCTVGLHIGNTGLTQADKNTLYGPQFIECDVALWNESVNGQDTILINADFTSTYDTSVRMAGGSLHMLGGQFQGGSGTKGIEFTGSNIDWVNLKDVIFEGPATDIAGGSYWPRDGVLAEHTVFQGGTANVLMGVASSRLLTRACRFNILGNPGVGGGKITCNGASCVIDLTGNAYAVPVVDGTQSSTARIFRLDDPGSSFYRTGAGAIATDGSADIGGTGATRVHIGNSFPLNGQTWPSIYVGSSLDTAFTRSAAGIWNINNALNFEVAITAASAPNNTLFRDSADNKLKFKDNSGTTNALY